MKYLVLESNSHNWRESQNTESQARTKEHNHYDKRVVRREKVQQESNVMPLDFYGTYDSRKFCDWIAHLDY